MLYIKKASGRYRCAHHDEVIEEAGAIYDRALSAGAELLNPASAGHYIKLKIAPYEEEVFLCVFMNTRHEVIQCQIMFHGTIDGASVYPRTVVKAALHYNAAAVFFAHNHPSGNSTPSSADKNITKQLGAALALVDIRVLDHLVVGRDVYSFAENGLL